ncbi:helix-turn-helix domain-containing protein [Kineosporiaceae bacterium SCSIO 59966]|nr:helix-turn-helix domain-containing protein [Kineosporiaceae bacterium SCSIO 59966]
MTTASRAPDPDGDGTARPASQTLDRGLRTLELVAGSERPLSVAEVARALGLHRSIAYRMLRTLEDHALVARDAENRYAAGAGLAVLARQVAPNLQAAAVPELSRLANDVGMTAFLVVRQHDEAVTVTVIEPRQSTVHVVYRPGTRHPVTRGAPGLALLAGSPPVPGERPEVAEGRRKGWVATYSEVLPGMNAVASPVVDSRGVCHGAVSVVFVADVDFDELGERVRGAAGATAALL